MADRYWVGGTASWDGTAGTKWAATSGGAGGASVPTTADNVFFDASSTGTVTIASGNTGAASINCTGFTGTITGTAAITVAGSITLVTGMTYNHTGAVTITGTGTLTTAGKTFGTLTINGSGITVTLGSALNCGTRAITVTQGTFSTSASNYSVTAGSLTVLGSSTRTVSLNGSTVTLQGSGVVFSATTTTNLTFNAGTSTISVSSSSPIFEGGGLTFNNVSFTTVSSTGTININGANTYNTLTLTAPSAGIKLYQFGNDQTISTFVCAGASAVRRLFLSSAVLGTARTLTVTTWSTIADIDFRDISLNSSRSGTRLGDCGGNTNITFDTPKTVYWNLTGTQTLMSNGWATTSGGTPAVNNFPLPQDTAVFDDTGAATTVSVGSAVSIGTINMSARTSALTFSMDAALAVYGNVSYGSGVTLSGTNIMSFLGRSTTQTLTTAGKTVTHSINATGLSSTFRLGDAFTSNRSSPSAIYFSASSVFDTQGYNITLTGASSGILIGLDNAKTLTLGSSLISIAGTSGFDVNSAVTSLTVTANTATVRLTSASAKPFNGDGFNYNGLTVDQGGAGALTISGVNTLGDISNSYSATGATTITFANNQTVSNFTATGAAGNILTINSSATGTQRTLTKTSGTVSVDYLSIRDSNATGGATWLAGNNSTNVANNSGWIFSGVAPSGSSGFLAFFI